MSATAGSAADARGATFPGSAAGAEIVLTVDGIEHRGWQDLTLSHSVEAAALKFDLGLTDRWTAESPARDRLARPGARCALSLAGEVVLDGWVDALDVRYDATAHSLRLTGRDRVGDLVDGAARIDPPFEWADIPLDEFARRLCAPFGIAVQAQTEMGRPFARASVQPGESAWEAIERGCRQRGVLATSNGSGTLLLTRAGAAGEGAGALQLGGPGGNILAADGVFDWTQRHDLVVVRGDGEGRPTQGQARARDAEVARHRPRLLIAEAAAAPGAPDFQTRAEWEVRTAAARARRVTYTVPGWRGASGALWRVNTLITVRDAYLGLNRTMMLATVTFRLDADQGTRTEIEVVPPEAFERLPQPEAAPVRGSVPAATGGGPAVGLYEAAPGARDEGAGPGFRRRTDVPALPPSNPAAPRR